MRRFSSVRVRVTAIATAIVAAALILASVALVVATQNTLAGQARNQSKDLVREVSAAIRSGQSVPPDTVQKAIESGIGVQVRNAGNQIVMSIPGPETNQILMTGEAPAGEASSPVPVNTDPDESLNATASEDGGVVTYQSNGEGVTVRRIGEADNIITQEVVRTANGPLTITARTPLAQVANSIEPIVMSLRIGTPLLIVLVGSVTWFIAGRALRPIEDLRRQAASISQSHPDTKLPVPKTNDEVARLADTLNDMLARINASSTRQREFVSDASHELRSPITSMHTALEVASLHPETTSVEQLSEELLRETTRMQNMVAALLELARVEDGRESPLEPIDIAPAITQTTGEKCSELIVEADADQIESALRNLVDNARRYASSKVEVSILRSDSDVTIVVEDDGPGVPTDQRERIFERFARIDEGRARADGGVGIGLALVKRIAQRHHGTVMVGDSELGGARFSFQLPLRQPS